MVQVLADIEQVIVMICVKYSKTALMCWLYLKIWMMPSNL